MDEMDSLPISGKLFSSTFNDLIKSIIGIPKRW